MYKNCTECHVKNSIVSEVLESTRDDYGRKYFGIAFCKNCNTVYETQIEDDEHKILLNDLHKIVATK